MKSPTITIAYLTCCLIVITGVLLFAQPANAQVGAPSARDVVLLVRDGAGAPMQGVSILILEAGPPNEPYDGCITNDDGQCFTAFFPDYLYIIQFPPKENWHGRYFVPLEEQGGSGEYCPGPGFCVYFYPDPENPVEDTISFVVAERGDGLLVPAWDMSADAAVSPEPFFPPDQSTDDLDLSGLDAAIIIGPSPVITTNTVTPTTEEQVIVSTYNPGIPPTPTNAPTSLPVTIEPEPDPQSGPGDILLGLLVLSVVIGLLVPVVLWRRKQKS